MLCAFVKCHMPRDSRQQGKSSTKTTRKSYIYCEQVCNFWGCHGAAEMSGRKKVAEDCTNYMELILL